MRSCPGCGASSDGPGKGPLYVTDTGDWSCSACSTYGVIEDFDRAIAATYWDAESAPPLRASGTPEEAVASLRRNYIRDVVRNPVAVEQLREWAIGHACPHCGTIGPDFLPTPSGGWICLACRQMGPSPTLAGVRCG
jgi:hypothetical protein